MAHESCKIRKKDSNAFAMKVKGKGKYEAKLKFPKGKGVASGGPGVPVTHLCKPFLSKQPTIFRGENAMTIVFDTV